ncbi:DPP IV N-terminal domain-containing protein [candidate division KSB1 bacterium]|nr:DPP IV N-terminal domain-containing protein [candidate division KSB1 bacterium]
MRPLNAQLVEFNHPELKWRSLETEHFFVHFHPEAERTARIVAKIAEEIHAPLATFYEYTPDTKVHWIIRDHDDYSNGATFYYDNKIEIWATAMDFELRGAHNWLRNVITHEYTHMISLGAGRKLVRQVPAIYLQMLGYEHEKRPDVLFGFPNRIVSYPLAQTVFPMWFAEGVAQFQLPGLNYDTWDTHRDMILRTAVLQDYLLTLNAMGVFEKNSVGSEMVYNQGYSLVFFIAHQYGVPVLQDLLHAMQAPWRLTFNRAVKKVLGISEKELYEAWHSKLKTIYNQRLFLIQPNQVNGEILHAEGTANFHPVWAPDGKRVIFLSNKGRDYLGQTSIYEYNFETKKVELIKRGVNSSCAWSPDGTKLVYARKNKPDHHGSHYYDLYLYDLKQKKETQLTRNQRIHSPDWSPGGDKIVGVKNQDGTNNLIVFEVAPRTLTQLTDYTSGEQIYQPRWSHNAKVIVFSCSQANSRDLMLIREDGKTKQAILDDEFDARDAVFSADDQSLIFSYDKTGIYNLYSLHLKSGRLKQLTNVLGGAFMPSVNGRDQIVFATFDHGKYQLTYLKAPEQVDPKVTQYVEAIENFHRARPDAAMQAWNLEKIGDGQYNDSQVSDSASSPYRNIYSKMSFLPRVVLDYKSKSALRMGTYFYSSDILNRYSILGGFAVNRKLEYDLFASFEYRRFRPTLFLDLYAFGLKTSTVEEFIESKPTTVDYGYQLLEGDLGSRLKLTDAQDLALTLTYSRYRANQKFELNQQLNKIAYNYYVGKKVSLKWTFNGQAPYLHADIQPLGRKLELQYDYELNDFIKGFKISQYSTLVPDFEPYNYSRFTLDWLESVGLFANRHSLSLHLQGGLIGKAVHPFFNYFAGGLLGMRGYPYYSMEGRKLAILGVRYRFPIWKNIDQRLLHFYFDKLFGSVFFDYGNAFNQNQLKQVDFKRDLGFELRLNTVSFYAYPAYLFVSGAYGLDQFRHEQQWYGKEWRYYFGLAFGYWE